MGDTDTYRHLNREWKATCRTVLGEEVGELSEFGEYLAELNDKFFVRKSSLTGADVVFTNNAYCKNAKITGMEDVDFNKKFEPLSINEMKDIDSIVEAVQERAYYCGNIVIGNSKFIEKSSSVSDSFYVSNSVKISGCKNVAHSQYMRLSENIFGTNEGGDSKFCIRCVIVFNNTRDFELWIGGNCTDCYYSYGLEDCRDCIFSFNLIGKSCAVGNTVLPRDKYAAVKKKLLSDICDELRKDKKLPSLVEITSQSAKDDGYAAGILKDGATETREERDMGKIERDFSACSRVVLGKELKGIGNYAGWLKRDIGTPFAASSAISKKPLYVADYPGITLLPKDRLLTQEEAVKLGEYGKIPENNALGITLGNAHENIGKIAYYPPERRIGTYKNLIECCWGSDSADCYRTVICAHDKSCSYSVWPRNSESCFGCGLVYHSQFNFKCHDSVELKRCLELDSSRGCADSMFCHNVESMENAMFCFNVKNLRYAVGNAEIGKDKYASVKKSVQEWMLEELERKKTLPLSIFNLGCKGKY